MSQFPDLRISTDVHEDHIVVGVEILEQDINLTFGPGGLGDVSVGDGGNPWKQGRRQKGGARGAEDLDPPAGPGA